MKRISTLLLLAALFATVVANAQLWKPLDDGLAYIPLAMTSDRHDLYVVYTKGFDGHKGKIYEVSIWNGSYWKTLPSFTTDSLSSITRLKLFNGFLYLSGKFAEVAELTNAQNIIRWNFILRKYESITPTKQDPSEFLSITDIEVYDNKLFMVGEFSKVQLRKAKNIIQFDGKDWIEPSIALSSVNGFVYDIEVHNDTLYFGGSFTSIGAKPSKYFAGFSNGNWVYYPTNTVKVVRMENSIQNLFIYGVTSTNPENAFFRLKNGILERATKGLDVFKSFFDMAVYEGELWACGSFFLSNDANNAQSLIHLRNDIWELSTIPNIGNPTLLNNFNGSLIVAGYFTYFNNIKLNRIAEFDLKSNRLSGKVYNDINGDCQFSAPDGLVSDRFVLINPGNRIIKLDALGNYVTYVPEGTYSISVIEKKYWKKSDCGKQTQVVYVNENETADSLDFPIQMERNISDVRVNISNYAGWVTNRGKVNLYVITFENIGSNFIQKGSLKMKLDEKIVKIQSVPVHTSGPEGLQWQYENLKSGDLRKILVYATIPIDFPKDKMQFSTSIEVPSGEQSIIDNTDTLNQKLSNEIGTEFGKQVYPSATYPDSVAYIAPTKQDLTYTISFANFGTSMVNNVFVIDTIDLNVDMQFIQELGASHPYTTKIISGPPGSNYGVLVWTFMNANLKPNPTKANDFIGDKGYISFKVRLKSSLPDNTVIKNKADVIYDYSDFNTTNMVYNQVDYTLGIGQLSEHNQTPIKLYPNPALNVLTIETELPAGFEWIIYDIRGVELLRGESNNATYFVDLADLNNGLYILKVFSENSTLATGRFLKSN